MPKPIRRPIAPAMLAVAISFAGAMSGCSAYVDSPIQPTVDSPVEPTVDPPVQPAVDPPVEPTADPPTEPTADPPTEPAAGEPSTEPAVVPPTDTKVITQRGIGSLEVGGALSTTDIETYFSLTFSPRSQTEYCSLNIQADVGLATVSNADTATMAFIIENPELRTAEGIGAGSTYDEVFNAYGEYIVDDYVYPSHTGGPMILVDDFSRPGAALTEDTRLMAFDTDPEGTVTRVRVGMWPWVGFLDYCSDDAGRSHTRTGWPLTRLP